MMTVLRIILVLLVALPLVYFWDKDIIPVNEGFGWDGNMYGMYTQHWDEAMKQKAVNEFRMHRILVPFLCGKYYALKGITTSKEELNRAYRLSIAAFFALASSFFSCFFHEPWMNGESWAINAGILITCLIIIIIADKKGWLLQNQVENMNLINN